MPHTYRQLDLAERRTIFRLLNAKTPIAVIARELGRHRSTIHREVRRNHFHGPREYAGYYPLNAQDRASERRRRQRKLCRNLALRDTIIAGLERCWSPEQIAGRLKHEAGDSCRTVTFDRGTEFAAYALLARASGTAAFFCDPHSPWQNGAIENTNGRIRRFLPGDRNLAELAEDELQRVTTRLNATPRRCLGYRTPHEAFHEQLATLPRAA